jgi:hypothetical protein
MAAAGVTSLSKSVSSPAHAAGLSTRWIIGRNA